MIHDFQVSNQIKLTASLPLDQLEEIKDE